MAGEITVAGKGLADFRKPSQFWDDSNYVLEFRYVTIEVRKGSAWNVRADRPYRADRWTYAVYHSDEGLVAESDQRGFRTMREAMYWSLNRAEPWVTDSPGDGGDL